MREFFITANSFAYPIFSDRVDGFTTAETAAAALEKFAAEFKHPAGLYAAFAYENANAYHKNEPPLAKWLCNHEIAKTELTKDRSGFIYCGNGPGNFSINGNAHIVENPKDGRVVE